MKRLDYANITLDELYKEDYTPEERAEWERFHSAQAREDAKEKQAESEQNDPFKDVLKKYERK